MLIQVSVYLLGVNTHVIFLINIWELLFSILFMAVNSFIASILIFVDAKLKVIIYINYVKKINCS